MECRFLQFYGVGYTEKVGHFPPPHPYTFTPILLCVLIISAKGTFRTPSARPWPSVEATWR